MGDFGSITVANDRMGMGRITGLEPWASDAKWDGTPSKRKSYLEKMETKLKRFPEMMAMWNSALSEGYSKDNFAALSFGFAKERTKQRMRAARNGDYDANASPW